MAGVTVKVWGDFACFSRPEFKVERVSYPVPTPSAARGILEAIFWKPEFRYEVRRIGILKMGTPFAILRNEVENHMVQPFFVEDKRQQRASLVLKGVAYLIEAEMVLRPQATDPIAKYWEQFARRLERGQYHHTPYLGTREFPAYFAPPDGEEPDGSLDLDLGPMLFDIAFVEDPARPQLTFKRPGKGEVKGYALPLFFHARIKGGWLEVPKEKYQELYRLEGGHAPGT
ncbi:MULTISPECIES: type I-C CRISPR-associated protein Cas5c [Thermus]|uniref:pre-crRNA processing endonuclease n=1 Tax=Thermus brockianus TaxID=56956 RepID=A0A1J0LVM6_THEBO|nr:type I-C CRISPR-associated protein Cas5c [Thermus brockianus]APD10406.1 CRISPR pre-crRNA endoribonuclease Cas5d [Thermus brockianus]